MIWNKKGVCRIYIYYRLNGMGIEFLWSCHGECKAFKVGNFCWEIKMKNKNGTKINSFIWILWWNVLNHSSINQNEPFARKNNIHFPWPVAIFFILHTQSTKKIESSEWICYNSILDFDLKKIDCIETFYHTFTYFFINFSSAS